jgi:uncharacterized protein YhdP
MRVGRSDIKSMRVPLDIYQLTTPTSTATRTGGWKAASEEAKTQLEMALHEQ